MKRLLALLALCLLIPAASAQAATIFSDDFNGSSVDLTKWNTSWPVYGTPQGVISGPASGLEQGCYDPAQSVVSGGMLHITAVTRACHTYEGWNYSYATDQLSTFKTFSFIYGKVSARICMPSGPQGIANWPQFWTVGYAAWPNDGEIDIVEGSQGWAMIGYHAPRINWNLYPAVSSPSVGCHIFAADWRKGSITYYLDNVQVGRYTRSITTKRQYVNIGLGIQPNSWGMPIVTPSTMDVDWVTVTQ